jgi:hypothetical protein
MSYFVYQINLPENPEAVVFVNGFVSRNRAGFFWMWRKLLWIKNVTANYNETYSPLHSGKYINEPQGMATLCARS